MKALKSLLLWLAEMLPIIIGAMVVGNLAIADDDEPWYIGIGAWFFFICCYNLAVYIHNRSEGVNNNSR